MKTVAVAIICKTPIPGQSKTRLSPPLRPEECAGLSACFIRDLSATIGRVSAEGSASGHVVYTPQGTEDDLRTLLPAGFGMVLQGPGDLGARLLKGISDLIAAGHDGAILVNSDSPTLPASILRAAVEAVRSGDKVVLGPALDGGYTLIGLSRPHARLFEDIPWSTETVYELTLERAREINLPVVSLPVWYDVDDANSLRMLEAELSGTRLPFAIEDSHVVAAATRRFLAERKMALAG